MKKTFYKDFALYFNFHSSNSHKVIGNWIWDNSEHPRTEHEFVARSKDTIADYNNISKIVWGCTLRDEPVKLEKVTKQDVDYLNKLLRELGYNFTFKPEERDPDFYIRTSLYCDTSKDREFYGTLDEAKAFADKNELDRLGARDSFVIYDTDGNAVAWRRWAKGGFKPGAAAKEEENGFFQGWDGFLAPWENIGPDENFATLAELNEWRERHEIGGWQDKRE